MIRDLQMRMRQLGEIRIGHVVEMDSGKTRPAKLDKFRFTSPSQAILTAVAEAFGGSVQPWEPANGGPSEFEVFTTTNRLPIIIPPQAVTQWYELYKGSKCVRRCDGYTEQKSDEGCKCNPEHRDCAMTTRLNVMLRDVPPIGLWLLTTRGFYAATELPAVADLLARGGGHIPGWLAVEERRIVREKAGGGTETIRFMVPTLDIDLSPSQILSGSGGVGPALESVNRTTGEIGPAPMKAIESAPTDCTAFINRAAEARDVNTVKGIWLEAVEAGCIDAPVRLGERDTSLREMLTVIGKGLADAAKPVADGDTTADRVAVWTRILTVFNGTTDECLAAFYKASGGREPADCAVVDLRLFLEMIEATPEPESPQSALDEPEF